MVTFVNIQAGFIVIVNKGIRIHSIISLPEKKQSILR